MRTIALTGLILVFAATPAFSQSWTIGNEQISRTLNYEPSRGLYTQQLSDLVTHTSLISVGAGATSIPAEFSFQCDGQTYSGASSSFKFVDARENTTLHGKSLAIKLLGTKIPIEVTVTYATYDGHPAIRKWLTLHNTGSAILHISHLEVEAISPSAGPANEVILNAQYGAVPRETFYTGRSEDAGLLIANGLTGDGFAVLNEIPGYMKRTEINAWYDPGQVNIRAMYDTDLMPFERSIKPGEEFKTDAVSFIAFRKDDGFHDSYWVLPTYTSEILQRRIGRQGAPWIYNTWEPFQRKINRETTLELINVAGNIGIDIFTIDDGWQREYGENAVDPVAFPGGLDSIRQAVEAKGMRLGLWIPLAAIGTSAADYAKHPEWAALDQSGNQKLTDTAAGSKVVMCLASPFRDSAADRVNDAIDRFHLAYVKLDLTTIFNAYGEAPGCWAKNHDHGSWAESLNMIYEGIRHVTAKVYEKHPDVLLDLTFELWGQKHVIDAGLLAAGDLDWMSNVGNFQPNSPGALQARTLLYQRAISMPAESMLIGNLQASVTSPDEAFATEIGSAPLLLGDLRKLSAADQDWYKAKIKWFKALRASAEINESFFPLGSWRQPSPAEWDGFARMSRTGHGVIAVFRNQSNALMATIQLPLIPSGNFKLHSIIQDKDVGVFSKAEWQRGVPIKFSSSQRVEILEISPIETPHSP
jgi:alpha-galactosidase